MLPAKAALTELTGAPDAVHSWGNAVEDRVAQRAVHFILSLFQCTQHSHGQMAFVSVVNIPLTKLVVVCLVNEGTLAFRAFFRRAVKQNSLVFDTRHA